MYILDIFSLQHIGALLFIFLFLFKLLHNIARVDVTVDLTTPPFTRAFIRDLVTHPVPESMGQKASGINRASALFHGMPSTFRR